MQKTQKDGDVLRRNPTFNSNKHTQTVPLYRLRSRSALSAGPLLLLLQKEEERGASVLVGQHGSLDMVFARERLLASDLSQLPPCIREKK